MAANKIIRMGPTALTAVTTVNLLNPGTVAAGTGIVPTPAASYVIMKHIRVTNKTNGAIFFALWLGATGANTAGTEVIAAGAATAGALNANTGISVPANSAFDWYGALRLDNADFLVGGASAVGLTIEGEGEQGIAG